MTKIYERWVNVYSINGEVVHSTTHFSREEADGSQLKQTIRTECLNIIHEYTEGEGL